ncbi:hypothetical protein KY285_017455 [Solanum tuberosum]|nr:hypothetical protein KY285_017455 [Solanum tuberosum]
MVTIPSIQKPEKEKTLIKFMEYSSVEETLYLMTAKTALTWQESGSNVNVRSRSRQLYDTSISKILYSVENVSQPEQFMGNLSAMFDNLTAQATTINLNLKYADNSDVINSFDGKLHASVQCLPDLSAVNCVTCLKTAFSGIRNLSLSIAKVPRGVRILLPSCNLRYELYPFLYASVPPSTRQGNEDEGKNTSKTKLISIIIGVILAILAVVLAGTCFYLVKRRRRIEKGRNEKSREIQLLDMIGETLDANDDFGSEKQGRSREFPVVKLDLIRAATQKFSEENKLGEGGFGPVYKGTLANGIAIAIKRLSRTSEGNEALLIYEFMPNKILDFFLFDSRENEILEWRQRVHIIKGIAKDMNPKISDFGMAKMFSGNQREANTNRVIGTYGYMAPEYAMEGLFSTKSDVFSFGVLLLEIVSGRKNNSYVSEYGQSLLNFAWKLWCEEHGLELMDPCLSQSCVTTEITKCIHIGLLCVQQDPADRPTMSSVVFMLENDTKTFPQPSQPAFSIGRLAVRSAEPRSNDQLCSVNEVTLSILSPR